MSCVREIASLWRSALSVRERWCARAMVEDWSTAMSSASLGKRVAIKGDLAEGLLMVGVRMVIVGLGFVGWLRVIVNVEEAACRV